MLAPGAEPAGEEWLRYRLAFFYDAALPSVAAQSGADFAWLVLFDDRCPDSFRTDVEDLAADGLFSPLWSHEPFRRDTFAGPVLRRAHAPHLITTRMDSDDALARIIGCGHSTPFREVCYELTPRVLLLLQCARRR